MSTPYELAMAARTNGDLAGAAELLQREIAFNPADERARFALGVISVETGDAELAVRTLHPLVVAHPANAELLRFYAVALRGVRRYQDAIRVFKRANEVQPSAEVEEELKRTTQLLEQQPAPTTRTTQQSAPTTRTTQQQPAPPASARSTAPAASAGPASAGSAAGEDVPDGLLASNLDSGQRFGGRSPEVRGNLRHAWHRRLTSYRRFWLGAVLVLIGIVLKLLGIPHAGPEASEPWSVPRIADHADIVPLIILVIGVFVIALTFISARFTRYLVYEHRIDFERGVLSQRRRPVWLFDITGISLRRTPLLTLTGTAQIVVEYDAKEGKPSRERLIATGGARAMADYAETLQGEFLRERRAMKKLWI
jgi:membrane protein YdbS with pleckstrin-like domain